MSQIWTIIFITLVAIGWGLAEWHDREEKKRQRRNEAGHRKRNRRAE